MPGEQSAEEVLLPFPVLHTLEGTESVEQEFVTGKWQDAFLPATGKKQKKGTKLLKKMKSLVSKPKYRLKEVVEAVRRSEDGVTEEIIDLDDQSSDSAAEGSEGQSNVLQQTVVKAGRDLYIQVESAQGLRAADFSGSSDPFCVVTLGDFTVRTQVMKQTLEPAWNETFSIPAAAVQQAFDSQPLLQFAIWGRKQLVKKELLGQAELDLQEVQLEGQPHVLQLHALKDGQDLQTGLGQLQVSAWLAPQADMQRPPSQGVLQTLGEESQLLSLCMPEGVGKQLPLVISAGNAYVYEEPCMCYLSLLLSKIQLVDKGLARNTSSTSAALERSISRTPSPQRKRFHLGELRPRRRGDSEDDDASTAEGSDEEQDDVLTGVSDNDSTATSLPNDGHADPDDATTPNAPANSHKGILYCQVSLGSQRHTTRAAKAVDGRAVFDQRLAFIATLPLTNRTLKLVLFATNSVRNQGKKLAHAYIPVSSLLPPLDSEGLLAGIQADPEWFQLRQHTQNKQNSRFAGGAAQLGLAVVDTDCRRQLFGQRMLHMTGIDAARNDDDRPGKRSRSSSPQRAPPSEASSLSTAPSRDREVQGSDRLASASGRRGPDPTLQRFDSQSRSSLTGRSVMHHKNLGETLSNSFDEVEEELPEAAATAVSALRSALRPVLTRVIPVCQGLYQQASVRLQQRRPPRSSSNLVGMVRLVLRSISLPQPENVFVVLKCGPHWGKTVTRHAAQAGSKPVWNWQVHLPLYDPSTLLLVALFSHPGAARFTSSSRNPPQLLAKLRLRLSTIQPHVQHECELPMLAPRSADGRHFATASMALTVDLHRQPHNPTYLAHYFEGPQPEGVYLYQLHEDPTARWLAQQKLALVAKWLAGQPEDRALPKDAVKAVLDQERQQFSLSRARANWRRMAKMQGHFSKLHRFVSSIAVWDNPLRSMCAMVTICILSFHPHVVLSSGLLALAVYAWLSRPRVMGHPKPMESDPEALSDDEVNEGAKNPYSQLKQRYAALQKVALQAQVHVEDIANTMERLHAIISWADPAATGMFVAACVTGAVLIASLGWPVVQAATLCFMMRPPFLKDAYPPKPKLFFDRLPTKADQLI